MINAVARADEVIERAARRMSLMGQSRPGPTSGKPGHVRCSAESGSRFRALATTPRAIFGLIAMDVIQAPKPEPRSMRYELSDYDWTTIKLMLPNKPRGVRRENGRRVLMASSRPQPDRTVFQQDQAMSACRDPIRQARSQLSGVRQTRINPNLATR